MQCAAMSAPQLPSLPRGRATIGFVPIESVEAASRRRSSSGCSAAKAPNPAVPVDSTAARRRPTSASAVARETPAAAYVFPSAPTQASVTGLQQALGVQLGSPLRAARDEADGGDADPYSVGFGLEAEQLRQGRRLQRGVVGAQAQLQQAQLAGLLEELVEPVARRMDLDAEARAGRDERPPSVPLLHPEAEPTGALQHRLEPPLVERDAEMIDPRRLPCAGLEDDVDGASLELRQPVLEAEPVELLPGRPRLERGAVLADPSEARDEGEPELADVPLLERAHVRRHEVVVEELHAVQYARAGCRGGSYTGGVDAGPSPLTSWSFEPLQLAPIALVGFLYWRRARRLRQRGQPVPGWRRGLFGLGLALLVLAVASPIDTLGEEQFFFAHMTQHVLLGDLAPLAIVAGLTGPLLRPVLAI